MKTFAPKNQHQLVMWYLFNYAEFSLKFVINDTMFFKFQSRLSTLELKHGTFTKKRRVSFTNRFGNPGSYLKYSISNKELATKVLNELI